MADRQLPVRPNLVQLRHQAQDLLGAIQRRESQALEELARHHPRRIDPRSAKLADAALVLARSYGVPSWPRLALACRLIEAIWRDDAEAVRVLVQRHPRLLHEPARGVARCNWGPPMSYAANLGRERMASLLFRLGAADLDPAFERACLQGRIDTARALHALGARPGPGSVMGPAETHCAEGLALLLELGAPLTDAQGDRLAPVASILETYSRNPEGKHRCLELCAEHGVALPDTPTLALHRGRVDRLEVHRRRDPGLLSRTFTHAEIYPPALGCHADPSLALHGAPLAGSTLLHQAVDFDELEIARWLIEHGADVNARAEVDEHGFGGHTPLFGCVVSQPYRVGRRTDDLLARLLLDHGADPGARASLRKRLRFVGDESEREYRDVTPLALGERFHDQAWVNRSVLELCLERGGRR